MTARYAADVPRVLMAVSLPDAPRGMKLISRSGPVDVAIEVVYFLPLAIYAVLPRRARGDQPS